jgi:hypothetical protein
MVRVYGMGGGVACERLRQGGRGHSVHGRCGWERDSAEYTSSAGNEPHSKYNGWQWQCIGAAGCARRMQQSAQACAELGSGKG